MARANAQRQVNNFAGGLVTEAGPLNFPENSLSTAFNVVINRDGSAEARRPFSTRTGQLDGNISTITDTVNLQSITPHYWEETGAIVLLVKDIPTVLGPNRHRTRIFVMDIADDGAHTIRTVITVGTIPDGVQENVVTTEDRLFFKLGTLGGAVRFYTYSTNSITASSVETSDYLSYRDFKGVPNFEDSTLTTIEDPLTPSFTAFSTYNLFNAGWPQGQQDIIRTDTVNGDVTRERTWPLEAVLPNQANSAGWPAPSARYNDYLTDTADNADDLGRFNTELLRKDSTVQTQRVQRGRSIIKYGLDSTRSFPSSMLDPTTTVPLASEFSSYVDTEVDISAFIGSMDYINGRMWYATPGRTFNIMFSQIDDSTDGEWFRKCYQEADPTDPDVNDLVASDGGTLSITDTGTIYKFIELGRYILVIAEKGVWSLASSETSFVADNISIEKVSNYRALSRQAVKEFPFGVAVATADGLLLLSIDQFGRIEDQDVTSGTLRTKWNDVAAAIVASPKHGIEYDTTENTVIVYYNKNTSYAAGLASLNVNLSTGSFFEWDLDPCGFNSSGVTTVTGTDELTTAAFMVSHQSFPTTVYAIGLTASSGTWDGTIGTTITDSTTLARPIAAYVMNTDYNLTEYSRSLEQPIDFALDPDEYLSYDSTMEIPFDTIGNAAVDKIAETITVFLDNSGHVGTPTADTFHLPGTTMAWKWDFDADYKTDNAIDVGRIKQYPVQTNYLNKSTLVDKMKLRGRGKELTLKFDRISGNGTGFKLLGYIIDYTGADRP